MIISIRKPSKPRCSVVTEHFVLSWYCIHLGTQPPSKTVTTPVAPEQYYCYEELWMFVLGGPSKTTKVFQVQGVATLE